MKILLVDDDVAVLAALSMVFRHLGMLTTHASCGSEALVLLETHSFDLIMLDMTMPRMNGLEVLRHLRENERTQDTPVIFLTGQQEAELRDEALALGAADYLLKPFELAGLLNSIRRVLAVPMEKRSYAVQPSL